MSARGLRPSRAEALAALAAAVLFAIAFPPFSLVVPAFLCLIPFAVAVARAADASEADGRGGGRSAARVGFWFGLLGYGCNLYWIAIALSLYTKLAILGYVASLLVVAPVVAAAGAALYTARRLTRWPMAVLLPVVWVASELLFEHMSDLSFPWLPLGLAVTHVPALVQIADLSGVQGVSFWIAATNGLLADAWLLRARRRAVWARIVGAGAITAAVALYGVWRLRTTVLEPVAPIAIVQPNVPQLEKWQRQNQWRIVGMLASLTHEAMAEHPRLVLWPEAALPGYLQNHADWADTLRALARGSHTPILFGVLDARFTSPTSYDAFNAAMLADSLGRIGTQPAYHKAYLVPVVERVPFVNPHWFRSLPYFGDFARGRRTPLYRFGFGKIGVLICFESIFPERSRTYRREGATLLVNITNDAWFGRSIAVYQHEAHLVLRAVENRVGIVRAANTGISSYIDPLGGIRGQTRIFVPAVRTYEAQTTNVRTLYVRAGDWLGGLSAGATLMLLAVGYRERHRRR